ncbi:MAG: family 20 glycosylhydrolase [Actinobacteria bacterium]|nr:family 20 glycosylhydrolase [Actinomycetota bacterium]
MTDADRLLLLPRPQRIELGGEGAPLDAPVHETRLDDLPAEGFELEIGPASVELRYCDESGLRYGRATLGQIRAQSADTLPGLTIRDWPDFPVRGYMLDISRDRVPTRDTLERLVELMALARLNQFQLYTEHTFAYRHHEVVWRDASPMTPDDIHWLDGLCRSRGIELVPNQNCFGHMARWLKHDAYRHRAETPDGYELLPGVTSQPAVLAPTEDNAAFALSLFDELLPHFTSRQVHIGCDETFELGKGHSAAEAEQRGKEAVYIDHLRRLVEPLVERGYTVQYWADIARKAPELVKTLPPGAVAVAWNYEAPRAADESAPLPPSVTAILDQLGIDFEAFSGFDANVAPIADAAVPFWVAPGTSSWNSLVGRIDNAMANIADAADVGVARGASGFLLTDWGDNGHLQPPSVSFGPLVYAGAVSWARDANRGLDLPAVLDRYVFDGPNVSIGTVLDRVGRVWRMTGQRTFNASPLQAALAPAQGHMIMGDPDAAKVAAVVHELQQAIADLERWNPSCSEHHVAKRELLHACRMARHGAWKLALQAGADAPSPDELAADRSELAAEHEACWLLRSRPGGLRDSLKAFR